MIRNANIELAHLKDIQHRLGSASILRQNANKLLFRVAAPARRHGNGARFIQAAERYAVERGFQARPFYEKLGYRVFATLDDYPPGHGKYFLRKPLTNRDPP